MLKYETLFLGDLETNCYLIWDEDSKETMIIDPAEDGVGILEEIIAKGLIPRGILLTHGHFDHVLGALDLKLIYKIPIYASELDFFLLKRQDKTVAHFLKRNIPSPNIKKIDEDLEKIKEIKIGEEKLEVITTPGHTPGSVCFYSAKQNWLFSGDTIFLGERGRTDFGYSSTEDIYKSIKKLMKLPKETLVLPGHGEETTIKEESKRYI